MNPTSGVIRIRCLHGVATLAILHRSVAGYWIVELFTTQLFATLLFHVAITYLKARTRNCCQLNIGGSVSA